MNKEIKETGSDFELVYTTRKKVSKEELKHLKEVKQKAVKDGKVVVK